MSWDGYPNGGSPCGIDQLTSNADSARLVYIKEVPSMLAKLAVLAIKYRAVIELVKAWWQKRKEKKNKAV